MSAAADYGESKEKKVRKSEKGESSSLFLVGIVCVIMSVGYMADFIIQDDYQNKRTILKKQFNIDLPAHYRKFTAIESSILQPAIEKRLNELKINFDSVAIIFGKNQTMPSNTNEAFNNLIVAENNLKEACEAAKYFEFVPNDCEPCKAVK